MMLQMKMTGIGEFSCLDPVNDDCIIKGLKIDEMYILHNL